MEILLQLAKSNEYILNSIYILCEKCDASQFVGEIVRYIINECKNV